MVIVNSEVDFQIQQVAGNYRVKFKYTLDDGRVYFVGPVNVNTFDEINTLLSFKETAVEETITALDADEAYNSDITTPHKSATQANVWLTYMKSGFLEDDPLTSYKILVKVMPDIIATGNSLSQLAAFFDISVARMQSVRDRWQYLNANKIAIIAYRTVKDDM